MSSLLPALHGQGTRTKEKKRKYVFKNIQYIEYRTVACCNEEEMYDLEKYIKYKERYVFHEKTHKKR
jgi:hypothetical protein